MKCKVFPLNSACCIVSKRKITSQLLLQRESTVIHIECIMYFLYFLLIGGLVLDYFFFFFFYCSYFVSWVPMMRFNTDKRMEEELIIDLNNLFGAAELSSN